VAGSRRAGQGAGRPCGLSAAAEADFEHIIQWTANRFGLAQASVYAKTLSFAIEALSEDPAVLGAKARDEIMKACYVARGASGS
jgi:plasmid stabilization system protein ParE